MRNCKDRTFWVSEVSATVRGTRRKDIYDNTFIH